jgi:hypothetical protein
MRRLFELNFFRIFFTATVGFGLVALARELELNLLVGGVVCTVFFAPVVLLVVMKKIPLFRSEA